MKIRVCIFLLTLLPTLTLAAPGDERFLAAREAFRTGDRARLEAQYSVAQAAGVRGEAQTLDPWIEYWRLRQRIDELDDGTISDFLKRQNDSYLAERLRGDWLKAQGKKRQWAAYTSEYGYAALRQPDTELQCYALQARLAAQPESATATLAEARNLWFSILDLPESCMPLMDNLVRQGSLNVDDVWLRLRRLLENRRYQGVQRTADYLPGNTFPAIKTLEQIADKPLRYLDKLASAHNTATRQGRELLLFALQRLSRSDPTSAAARLRALGKKLSDEERAYAWGQLAWQAALRHQPEALDWYALANRDKGSSLSEEQRAWQIRAALRAHDWPRVQKAIDQLPPALATQADWIYWLGRARAEQGQGEEARALFLKIAGQPSFYGNLADEELGRRITLPPRPQPPSAEELAAVRNHAGLRRALALFRLGMRPEGVREWNWALRGMNDRLLLAAAHLAQSNEIFDRAIYSALPRQRPATNAADGTGCRLGLWPDASGKPFRDERPVRRGCQGADAADAQNRRLGGQKNRYDKFPSFGRDADGHQCGAGDALPADGIERSRPAPGAGLGGLQRRPGACPPLARRPATGRRHLRRDYPFRRNTRLRQKGNEQCRLLRRPVRGCPTIAQGPAGDDRRWCGNAGSQHSSHRQNCRPTMSMG